MKGSGGTEGGIGKYAIGLALCGLAAYLFFDSVRITTGYGWFSRYFGGNSAIVFVPFFLGIVALFYNAAHRWAWWLMYAGLGVIAIEIISQIHFFLFLKTTHFLMMLALFAAGLGLILVSYRKHE